MKTYVSTRLCRWAFVLFVVIVISCAEESALKFVPPPPPPIEDPVNPAAVSGTINLTTYRTVVATSLRSVQEQSDKYLVRYDNGKYVYLNYERLAREEAKKLNNHFKFENFDFVAFADKIDFNDPAMKYSGTPVLVSAHPSARQYFSSKQLSILDIYVRDMFYIRDAPSAVAKYNSAKNQINSSGMSKDEKIVAMSFIETGNEFAKSFFAGKWANIRVDVQGAVGKVASNCQVDWRSAWGAGVVAGVGGAIRGAITGAGAGTVTIPGIGTAGGVVGGAVFGFAIGFATGTVSKIARDLLLTCFRSAKEAMNMTLYCEKFPPNLREPNSPCVLELLDSKVMFDIRTVI